MHYHRPIGTWKSCSAGSTRSRTTLLRFGLARSLRQCKYVFFYSFWCLLARKMSCRCVLITARFMKWLWQKEWASAYVAFWTEMKKHLKTDSWPRSFRWTLTHRQLVCLEKNIVHLRKSTVPVHRVTLGEACDSEWRVRRATPFW